MSSNELHAIIDKDINDYRNCPQKHNCLDCEKDICVMIVALADFPTKFGHFKILGFVNNKDSSEHIAIVKNCEKVISGERILTRVHSACLTGDALGSLRCDCGSQLEQSLKIIEHEGYGILLYMQQEGRGIGLINKLRAYALQDKGYDTYDANIILGFSPDERTYDIAGEMIKKLDIKSIRLLTNNPEKIHQLEKYVEIVERVPIELPVSKYNLKYMKTKKQKFGHLLSIHDTP